MIKQSIEKVEYNLYLNSYEGCNMDRNRNFLRIMIIEWSYDK